MRREIFTRFLHYPELLDDRSIEDISGVLAEYPYFQTARLLMIKNLQNQGSIKYDKELKKTALWVTDRRKLFYLLDHRVLLSVDDSESKIVDKQPEEPGISDVFDFSELTRQTSFPDEAQITFINSKRTIEDELETLILSGSAGAGTFFEVDDKIDLTEFKASFTKKKSHSKSEDESEFKPADRKSELIDKFIRIQPRIVPDNSQSDEPANTTRSSVDEPPDLMTDTLAKIYVKQGLYEKAIFTYEKLSLKYPEKSSYFAGQIKKIKQLISNL